MAGTALAVRGLGLRCRQQLLPCLLLGSHLSASLTPSLLAGTRLYWPGWTQPRCSLHCSPLTLAGHNKWSKVKHIKGPKDSARSRVFMKLAMMLRHAVREGGANPDLNTQLGNIIEQCRGVNMPKASIEAAMKGADKSKASSYALYEARGPGGSSLLIEILTDNNTRSHQEIKHILNKNGGALSDGARHRFQRKGVVVSAGEVPLDRALELAIEAGAEDVREIEDEEERPLLQFLCDVSSLRSVREALQALGVQTLSAGPEFVACTSVQLSDSELEAASKLLELLNDCLDVIRVYDNIQPLS
ncbi:TACO1 oxidase, partial [Polyodon spathula]|nr:TACO1 oxidase [Polyodon spathula]